MPPILTRLACNYLSKPRATADLSQKADDDEHEKADDLSVIETIGAHNADRLG
jgi:predicted flap endonuclease-1-like 5' DNA nuclease